jgi:hypothetical protein
MQFIIVKTDDVLVSHSGLTLAGPVHRPTRLA